MEKSVNKKIATLTEIESLIRVALNEVIHCKYELYNELETPTRKTKQSAFTKSQKEDILTRLLFK